MAAFASSDTSPNRIDIPKVLMVLTSGKLNKIKMKCNSLYFIKYT